MLATIIWVACCIGVGYWAQQRGRSSFVWALIAMVISPVIAFIVLAIMKNLAEEGDKEKAMAETQQLKDRLAVDEVEIDKRLTEVENEVKELKGEKAAELEGKIGEIKELRDAEGIKPEVPAGAAAGSAAAGEAAGESTPERDGLARQGAGEGSAPPLKEEAAEEVKKEIPPEIQEVKDSIKAGLRDAEHEADYATSELRSEIKEVMAEINDKQ